MKAIHYELMGKFAHFFLIRGAIIRDKLAINNIKNANINISVKIMLSHNGMEILKKKNINNFL